MEQRDRRLVAAVDDIVVWLHGQLPDDAGVAVGRVTRQILGGLPVQVRDARVRVTAAGRTCPSCMAVAQINAVTAGRAVRAQAAAPEWPDAVKAAAVRLSGHLTRTSHGWAPRPVTPLTGPPLCPASTGPARVVRSKEVKLRWYPVAQAMADLDALDFDFHLFTDADTDAEAIVYRAGPTGYRLARQTSTLSPPDAGRMALTVRHDPAPLLSLPQAAESLTMAQVPFVFYTDADNGRGRVVYRRYDGQLALLGPVSHSDTTNASP